MHIYPHLGVFWRSPSVIQIGMDSRVGVAIEGLSAPEQTLVAALARPRTITELMAMAKKNRVSPDRVHRIIAMLASAGVLRGEPGEVDVEPPEGTHFDRSLYRHSSNRIDLSVAIDSLDAMGVAIGLALVECGVGTLLFDDTSPVAGGDHSVLWPRWDGACRNEAFLSALRVVAPHIRTAGEPQLTVVTGSRLINPQVTDAFIQERHPHLLVWSEEVDVCVGPLVEPGCGPCAGCLFNTHLESDPAWRYLVPQAINAPPVPPLRETRELAASLAARAVIGYLEGMGNSLATLTWRIPPLPHTPTLTQAAVHPQCGCTIDERER